MTSPLRKILLVTALLFFCGGGYDLRDYAVHSEPVVLPLASFTAGPRPPHVKLIELSFSPLNTVTGQFLGRPVAYVPVRPQRDEAPAEFAVVVRSNDSALIAASASPTLDGALTAWAGILTRSDVTGMIDCSVTDEERAQLHEANPSIAKNAVVILEGQHPSLVPAVAGMTIGVALLAFGLFFRKKIHATEPPPLSAAFR